LGRSGSCEHPIDSGARLVALFFLGGDFGDEAVFFVKAPVEALAAQDADFDFDHVQPTGVLGHEVEVQAAQDAVGIWRRKGFVECAGVMCREIVENDPDDIGVKGNGDLRDRACVRQNLERYAVQ
jgi:hypothetical protein